MEANELNWHSPVHPSTSGGDTQHKCEPPEFVFIGCIYIGSIGGTLAGCIVAKMFVGDIYPIAFGMLGCMLGTFVLCVMACSWSTWLARHESKNEHCRQAVVELRSVEARRQRESGC